MFSRKKQMEEMAFATAIQSDLAIRAISDGVVVCNTSGHILLINPAALEMSGFTVGDALGLDISSVITLLDVHNQAVIWDFKQIKQSLTRSDLQLKSNTGAKLTPVEIHIIPSNTTKLPDYQIVSSSNHHAAPQDSFIITLRDISLELKSEEARMDFISTASHEMRTPVATIDGYIDLALNANVATTDDRARGFLEKAKAASKHLGELFADLLDVTKIEDDGQAFRYEKVDVNALLAEVADEMNQQIKAKGLALNLASATTKINPLYYAMVDKTILREVLTNLIGNAIKYTEKGGIALKVTADDDYITISVKDTGIGIAPEFLPHIFQKFYRVDNTDTRQIGGTGLGLYIVKNSVENMHGKVWVESQPGQGSEFFISLPRVKNSDGLQI
ncbi:MAG: PAS domain-containing sensor histidine kinase [Candidatus Nomurabacteria bacterium]|jgi:signal transduction histidine kinase|nr:PAS domain-containing sensor histidine kinase [Candidatus Nomurabacteria bacterium]